MTKQQIYAFMREAGLALTVYAHEPVYTMEQAEALGFAALPVKNLFLTDRRRSLWALLVLRGDVSPDLRATGRALGYTPLSLGSPERLGELLHTQPGAVSPLCIVDAPEEVELWIDDGLNLDAEAAYHPGVNDETVVLRTRDLLWELERRGRRIRYVRLAERP